MAQSWSTVASEGGSFTISGSKTVRYGANSNWIQKTISGWANCSNDSFGSDPAWGATKSCQVDNSSGNTASATSGSWTNVATEWTSFTVSGTQTVRYGNGSNWVTATVNGWGNCTNDFFGSDPAWGQSKSCQVLNGSTSAGNSSSTPAAAAPSTSNNVSTSGNDVWVSLSSTSMEIPNPERGFYGWSSDYFQNLSDANLTYIRDKQGLRLTLGLINLSDFRWGNISQSFMDNLNSKFAMLRRSGIKVIIRTIYNYDGGGSDANAALIKTHTQQMQWLFDQNKDVIAYVQAGFIGAWGEWHSSASGNTSDSNKSNIRDSILASFPSTQHVQFRYPADNVKWYPSSLNSGNAFNGSYQSRAGTHNDCFMSDNTDVGTFSANNSTMNSQRDYVKANSEYAPFGGETCSGYGPMRQSCSQILSEGPAYHVAYLNLMYNTDFIWSWKNGGCYDQVMRSLGYRFQLDTVSHPSSVSRNGNFNVAIDIRNVGWSRIFSPRKLVVTLRNTSNGALISGTGTTDMRTLPSQSNSSTRVGVSVWVPSNAAAGNYEVLVSMPDVYSTTSSDSRYAVRFANADNVGKGQLWETNVGRFDIGSTVRVN